MRHILVLTICGLGLLGCDAPPPIAPDAAERAKTDATMDQINEYLAAAKNRNTPEISPHIESKPIEPAAKSKAAAISEKQFCSALGKALRGNNREFARAMIVRAAELDLGGLKFAQQAAIRDQKISLGMSKCMAIAAWGRPEDVNRTVGSYGVHEQWVYNQTYVYFENDTLSSWQD